MDLTHPRFRYIKNNTYPRTTPIVPPAIVIAIGPRFASGYGAEQVHAFGTIGFDKPPDHLN
jgi:hypothetical protein